MTGEGENEFFRGRGFGSRCGNGHCRGRDPGPCGQGLKRHLGLRWKVNVDSSDVSKTLTKEQRTKILEEELKEIESEKQAIEKELKEN